MPFLSDRAALKASLAEVLERDAAALPLLDAQACRFYLREAQSLAYRPARPVVGEGEKAVQQDFEVCMEIPEDSSLRRLSARLEVSLAEAARGLEAASLDPRFRFNDLIVQRYQPGSRGITPHVDHIRYQGLVAIVVFSGRGDFQLCADRSGAEPRSVAAGPGGLLLMRAPGFGGEARRPFHRLSAVESERVILGLRWDTRAGEPW
jgi:hypothetical protein